MVSARRVAAATTTVGGRVALGAAAIVLAACGGQHTASPATASPASSSPAPQSSNSATTVAVHLPTQLLGQNENTSAAAKQATSILDRQYVSLLTAGLGGSWKTAIYGGNAQNATTPTTDFFFVIAGTLTRPIASPDNVARKLQNSMLTRGITDAKLFPADANGEALVCGQTHMDIVCSWADHVSLGYVLYSPGFASSLSDGASKTSQVRSAVVR